MRRPLPILLLTLALGWAVVVSADPTAPAPAAEEAALRAVVTQFYAAWQKEDLDAFMTLWTAGSPERVWLRRTYRQIFGSDNCTFRLNSLSGVTVSGDPADASKPAGASATAAVSFVSVNTYSKRRVEGNFEARFRFAREGGGWKVVHYASPAHDLAEAQIAAKSDAERLALLESRLPLPPAELWVTLSRRGLELNRRGSFDPALEAFRIAGWVAERLGDRAGVASAVYTSADVHGSRGNAPLAREHLQRALDLSEQIGDRIGMAWALNDLGLILLGQGDYPRALDYLQRSLKVKEILGDRGDTAISLINLGDIYEAQGSYAPALEHYRKASELAEASREMRLVPNIALAIGGIHYSRGDFAEALKYYQEAASRAAAIGERGLALTIQTRTGWLHLRQGSYGKALELFEQSLASARELGFPAQIAYALLSVGAARSMLGEDAAALTAYRESLAIFEQLGIRRAAASALHNIGLIHQDKRDYPRALEFLRKSLALKEELGARTGVALTLSALGAVHLLRADSAQSMAAYRRGLELAEAAGDALARLECHAGIGDVHRADKRPEEAVAAYKAAVAILEAMRARVAGGEEDRLTFQNAAGHHVYQSLVEVLLEQGKTEEALGFLERARSKQLLDALRLRSLTVRDPNLRSLLEKCEQLEQAVAAQEQARLQEAAKPAGQQDRTRIANLSTLVAGTRAELLQVTNRIRTANPDYERYLTIKPTDLRAVQARLPAGVVVVEYLPLETGLAVFVVTRDGMKARSVAVPRRRLEELAGVLRAEVRMAQRDGAEMVAGWQWKSDRARRLRGALTALYGYLIAPVQADLEGAQALVVVPAGQLYYLPFQALARETQAGGLRFLVEEKPVAVLTSLDLWLQVTGAGEGQDGRRGQLAGLGAFGNPDGTLPEAEREVRQVGSLFSPALVYTGAEATRERLAGLPATVKVAHFATHGALSERDINDCFLMLADGQRLKLGEIYGLAGSYPAELTVLSACETALGRADPGNEVAHLAHAFVEAGSTTIVASLWQVAESSTARLMEAFYRELAAGKGRGEALRQAQLALLRDPATAHPFFWSPFVLIGDWR